MTSSDAVRLAVDSLARHKLRSALTMLGNVVGVTSVIAVASLMGGMDRYVEGVIAGEGSNVVTVERFNPMAALSDPEEFLKSLRNPRLTLADYRHLKGWIGAADDVAARARGQGKVAFGDKHLDGVVIEGWTANVDRVQDLELGFGRSFTVAEVERAAPVCVVGADLVDELFGTAGRADGATVRIGTKHVRIVGGLEDRAGLPGQSPNLRVLVPLSVFPKILGTRGSVSLPIRAGTPSRVPALVEEAQAAMRIKHRLRPDQADDFFVGTSEMWLDLWGKISRSIAGAVLGMVSVALVVGGIVIMNTMLVSVTERTREVGLKKALGARGSDITAQFLLEAVVLSVAGGALGILLGYAIAGAVARFSPLPYAIELWAVVLAVLVTVTVGLVFGAYPARRAAGLSPVEALRNE